MVDKVAAYMKTHHMVQKEDHISIAVSGGADSVCLFLILERLRRQMGFSLSVIHIEHGIRGAESIEDMHFACHLAERCQIPFACYAYPVTEIAKKQGISLEEAGRNVRYEAFAKEEARLAKEYGLKEKAVKTATAHHGDDSAETMLFHLCRGSGIEGLFGIRPVRGSMIRPLLCVTRKEIEAFLAAEGQPYRIDATNADAAYSRNRIRCRIMPELLQINGQAVSHMNRLADDLAEISEYLKQETDKILKEYMVKTEEGDVCFCLAALPACPPVLLQRAMLELIAEACGSRKDIAREHAMALLDIARGRIGRKISLPYGIAAEKSYGILRLYRSRYHREAAEEPVQIPVKADGIGQDVPGGKIFCRILENPKKDAEIPKNLYTKWFDYDKIKNRLYFRTREAGDYLVLDAQGHRQKLKKYWVNEKVPKAKRSRILLLADGSHILWAVGYRISEYYKVSENTKRILEVQFMEEEK